MADQLPAPYPIAWPPGRARTPASERLPRRYAAYTVPAAVDTLEGEVKRWRSTTRATRIVSWELTTNLHSRTRGEPDDPSAALWFSLGGKDITTGQELMVLACDRYKQLAQNIRAISLTMERLRLVDEVGAYSLVSAVEGAKALPPPIGEPPQPTNWRVVLDVSLTAGLAVAEAAYRALARQAGEGSPRLKALNLAIEAARAELKNQGG